MMVLIGLLAGMAAALLVALLRAPMGYEDEHGFHYGELAGQAAQDDLA